MDIKQLIAQGDQLFSKRSTLLMHWQDVADNFYVERADFTVSRTIGEDFAANLTSSYPLIVRRELGDQISAMLRPRGMPWMSVSVEREERLDVSGKGWLEWATDRQTRFMYDRLSGFVRATKQGDHDFAAFGQTVISMEVDWSTHNLLYRCWHLRDVAWCDQRNGELGDVHRKWKPSARELAQTFRKEELHRKVMECFEPTKDPYTTFNCRHIVMPVAYYQGDKKYKTPYVSIHIDVDNVHLIREEGSFEPIYCIPRWQKPSDSQYAFSPATVCGLPDARLLQAMTLTLLEAGEMAVRPPMVAVQDAIRGDVAVFAGGITWADAAYDERLGEVLRPITQDKSGLPFGMDMAEEKKQILAQAFYLNKLSLPPPEREMTAYETGQRIQEYIRNALPLFEPMESDYNGALCEMTFNALLRVGAFGVIDDIPRSVRGQDVRFKFESPLHQAIERQKGAQFQEAAQLTGIAMQLDPSAAAIVDVRTAFRDALEGIGIKAKWTRSEEAVEQHAQEVQQQQQQQAALNTAQQAAATAVDAGKAQESLSAAA